MKKILIAAVLLMMSGLASAVAQCDLIIRQLDAFGNEVPRVAAVPSGCTGANGILVYDIGSAQPRIFTFDSTLKFTAGVVGVDTSALPVTPFDFAFPSTRTIAVSTDYQSGTPTKAAVITISASCAAALTLAGGNTCSMETRVGPSTVTCSTGTVVNTWTNGNTGTLTLGLNTLQTIASAATIHLPIGGHFILCPLSGTFTIVTAVDQAAG